MTTRDAYLKRRYGITEADYDEILAAQGGVCALCGRPPARQRLVVDHDHKTQAIRGLIHSRENQSLGPFEFRPEIMLGARAYLAHMYEVRTGVPPNDCE